MPDSGLTRLLQSARSGVGRAAAVSISPLSRLTSIQPFVILCPPRTGSQLLVSLLDSHPAIRCEGEILHDGSNVPLAYLTGRATLASRQGHDAWGCKVVTTTFFRHGRRLGEDILDRLRDRGFRFILLRRRNWLLQAISWAHGAQTSWHFSGGSDTERRFTPAPEEVVHMLWSVEREDRHAEIFAERYDHLSLWYEDDLGTTDQQQRTVDRLAASLGLEPAPVAAGLTRGLGPRLEDRVGNLDEIAALVAQTRWGRFLEDDSA